jgi:hypothetical protein
MLTLSTVCAGINGSGVAGYTPGTHRPRVLYLDYEVGRRTMQKRLTGYANPNLFVVCFDDPELGDDGLLPLDTDAGQAQVLALIEALFVDIVVFDNLYSAVIGTIIGGPSDNSAVDKVTPFLRDLSKRGVASVLEHHSGHAADKAYGDDKMRWQMDNHVHLEFADSARDGELRLKLTEKKMRAERPRRAEPVELAYDSERKTWDVVEGGAKAPEMTGRQAWLAGTAMEMLDRTSHRVAERDYPVAYTKDLREAYKDKFWPHDRNGNGERQAWQRDVKACVTYFTVEAMYFYRCQKH